MHSEAFCVSFTCSCSGIIVLFVATEHNIVAAWFYNCLLLCVKCCSEFDCLASCSDLSEVILPVVGLSSRSSQCTDTFCNCPLIHRFNLAVKPVTAKSARYLMIFCVTDLSCIFCPMLATISSNTSIMLLLLTTPRMMHTVKSYFIVLIIYIALLHLLTRVHLLACFFTYT